MPEREAAWVAKIRAAATAAGHVHKMWGEAELAAAFGEEPMWAWFARARACLNDVTTWTLMSDYYRLRVLAHEPGLYLDTDFELRGGWPELAGEADVMGMPESFNRSELCNGVFMCREAGAFQLAVQLAAARLQEACNIESAEFDIQYIELVRGDKSKYGGIAWAGIGPGWIRRVVLPAWRQTGVSWAFFSPVIVGHKKWPEHPKLAHVGTGAWLFGKGRSRDGAHWRALAWEARRRCEKTAYEQFLASAPAHLHPKGEAILPEPRRPRLASRERDCPISLPRGTKRVLVLSNVRLGFRMPPLHKGDVLIHLNKAVHKAQFDTVPDVQHILVFRSGTGGKWFAPAGMTNYTEVVPATVEKIASKTAWLKEWKTHTSAQPSTGFLVANTLREYHPDLPLLLVGFAPDRDCGTYRWPSHNWIAEATWYKLNAFKLLPPKLNNDDRAK